MGEIASSLSAYHDTSLFFVSNSLYSHKCLYLYPQALEVALPSSSQLTQHKYSRILLSNMPHSLTQPPVDMIYQRPTETPTTLNESYMFSHKPTKCLITYLTILF